MDLQNLMAGWGRKLDDPMLAGCWPFDESQGDLVADRTGTASGKVVGSPQWRPAGGTVHGALELDGATYVTISPARNPTPRPFSVLAWIHGGGCGQTIISQQNKSNWLLIDAEGALMTELCKSDRAITRLTSQAVITDGNWHRIALTWDGANHRLYVDSILVAEDIQDSLTGSLDKLIFGASKALAPSTFCRGLIDDVRIHDRAVEP